jgi:hypothetical protein
MLNSNLVAASARAFENTPLWVPWGSADQRELVSWDGVRALPVARVEPDAAKPRVSGDGASPEID